MNLTLTEKYIVHNIDEKGGLAELHNNNIASAFMMDLIVNKFITLNNGFVSTKKDLTPEFEFLREVYNLIKENKGIKYNTVKTHLVFFGKKKEIFYRTVFNIKDKMINDKLLTEEDGKFFPNNDIKTETANEIISLINGQNLTEEQMFLFILFKNGFDFSESLDKDTRKIFMSQSYYYYSLYKKLMFTPHVIINRISTPIIFVCVILMWFDVITLDSPLFYVAISFSVLSLIFVALNVGLLFRNVLKKDPR